MTVLASGSSSAVALLKPVNPPRRDDLSAAAPGVGLGGQRGFEDLFRAARDHV